MTAPTGELRVVTRKGVVVLTGRGTLLVRLTAAGIPVASSCSGRGSCAKCVVQVVDGAEALSPPDAHELEVLERNQAPRDARLSCQCRVSRAGAVVTITTGYW